ncbi:MAG: hypothetical protein GY796_26305 [Chloroflexi bacterium]|nr:hypothetical protein [Chloroflexota bacterium]
MSNHVYGLAVDIFGWSEKALANIWSSQITNIALQFRLDRPFTEVYVNRENTRLQDRDARTRLQVEYWHFEPVDIGRYR